MKRAARREAYLLDELCRYEHSEYLTLTAPHDLIFLCTKTSRCTACNLERREHRMLSGNVYVAMLPFAATITVRERQ